MEHEARKSPHECQEQPHTAWVWSVKVSTHSALEKSQILTVPSPDEVARRAPLQRQHGSRKGDWLYGQQCMRSASAFT